MAPAMIPMNRRIQAFFDRLAPQWDEGHPPEMTGRIERLAGMLPLSRGMRALDIGAGTGAFFDAARQRIGPEGTLIAMDLSRAMLTRARAAHPSVPLVQGDAHDSPFTPGSFDAALCFNMFPHFLDQGAAIRECARLLRRDGFIAVMHSMSREEINALHRNAGGLIGGHCLPEDGAMRALFHAAGMQTTLFHATNEIYIVCAKKPSPDISPPRNHRVVSLV